MGVEESQWSMVLSRRRPVTSDVPINMSNLLLISMAAPVGSMVAGGMKTVETRKYALSQQFIGKPIYIWEKPDGCCRQRQARVIGVVRFSDCFQYKNQEAWAKDYPRHQVSTGSKFSWDGKMFGWVVENAQILASPFMIPSTVDIRKSHKCIFVARNFCQTSLLETLADGNTAKDGDPRANKGVQENVEAAAKVAAAEANADNAKKAAQAEEAELGNYVRSYAPREGVLPLYLYGLYSVYDIHIYFTYDNGF